jgi:hypothetical protein
MALFSPETKRCQPAYFSSKSFLFTTPAHSVFKPIEQAARLSTEIFADGRIKSYDAPSKTELFWKEKTRDLFGRTVKLTLDGVRAFASALAKIQPQLGQLG